MICPNCGEKNADKTDNCVKCGESLQSVATPDAPSARNSKIAVCTLVLAVIGFAGLVYLFVSGLLREFAWNLRFGSLAAWLTIPWFLPISLSGIARKDFKKWSGRLKGGGFARAGLALSVCNLILAFLLATVGFEELMLRRLSFRINGEMRSLATAIESYHVDLKTYPAWAVGINAPPGAETYNNGFARTRRASRYPADLPGFLHNIPGSGAELMTLTTPVSYISHYPRDVLSPIRGATFVYWSIVPGEADPSGKIVGEDSPVGGEGWILVSPGPDRKYDIPDDWEAYNPKESQSSNRLLAGTNEKGYAFTYDMTNGALSHGDMWIAKQ